MEEIEMYLEEAKENMEKVMKHLVIELTKVRAGRATPTMIEGLMVEYYGSPTPVQQVSSISAPDARTLTIKPFEKGLMSEIEKAIRNSDLGLNPQNNGEVIILSIPALTEERRRDLVKQVKNQNEVAKVGIRNVRKDTNEGLRALLKEGAAKDAIKKAEDDVQKLTDHYSTHTDQLCAKKETEIMTV